MLPVLAQVVGTVEHVNQAGDAEGGAVEARGLGGVEEGAVVERWPEWGAQG